jgi:hypothetical protein
MRSKQVLGSQLSTEMQRHALARYVHRFTGDHVPNWVTTEFHRGTRYPVQFRDDKEWLSNTLFYVTKSGALDVRYSHCESSPTFPTLSK